MVKIIEDGIVVGIRRASRNGPVDSKLKHPYHNKTKKLCNRKNQN